MQNLLGQQWNLLHGLHGDGGGHLHAKLLLEEALQLLQGQVQPRVGHSGILLVATGWW